MRNKLDINFFIIWLKEKYFFLFIWMIKVDYSQRFLIIIVVIKVNHLINLLQMSLKGSPQKYIPPKSIQTINFPLLTKLVLQKKNLLPYKSYQQSPPKLQQYKQHQSQMQSSCENKKDKFDSLYNRIQEMSHRYDSFSINQDVINNSREFATSDYLFKVIHTSDKAEYQQFCKLRTSLLQPRLDRVGGNSSNELQINLANQAQIIRQNAEYIRAQAILRRSRYHSKLKPLQTKKMSSKLEDYLSVERMSLKDNEQSIMSKAKQYKRYHLSNLFDGKLLQLHEMHLQYQREKEISLSPKRPSKIKQQVQSPKVIKKVVGKFKAPFEMYYYRDFVWKASFSNSNIVQIPEQYKDKIKFYVGGGNNSNLIKGIMARRPWFQLTDKLQDAQFIWTQIKVSHIFSSQPKKDNNQIDLSDQIKHLAKPKKQQNHYKRQYAILNQLEKKYWAEYLGKNIDLQRKIKPNMHMRSKKMKIQETSIQKRGPIKVHNHFCNNFVIGNKKALFQTMSEYYETKGIQVFTKLPLTFHIKCGLQDDQYMKFLQSFYAIAKNNKSNPDGSINKFNAWIVKPGQNTNRGNGITVCLDLNEIKTILKSKEKHNDGTIKTYILQKYIEKPLLYKKRKFDIRHYMMLNCCNGIMKGYWYRYGYVRTTSSEYTLKGNGGGIHLTNDAVQKYLPDYGKYEKGNKITYEQLDSYIKKQDSQFDFFKQVYPKMKQLATDAIHASAFNIDPQKRLTNFEIFGMDFMIDQLYNVWLIEINTNPCLQNTCPVLNQIIPRFIQNTLQICIDPLFPPPLSFIPKVQSFTTNTNEQNNFDLIFDQRIDKLQYKGTRVNDTYQDDDLFDDDGEDFKEQA